MSEKLELVIITGMSGAGRTVAMQSFEDMGYYAVDNMPPSLLPTFLRLIQESDHFNKVALVIDLRTREFFQEMIKELNNVAQNPTINTQVVFLDATDEELVARYKETRRNHPLKPGGRLMDGIRKERKLLHQIRQRSDDYYDTSKLSPRQLRQELVKHYQSGHSATTFNVQVMSFGFKHGIPIDADIVMDVRFLPNPYYIEELREQSGLDDPVYNYVMKQPETEEFYQRFTNLLDFTLPGYKREGKSSLIIAIGCTGGQHRSVALTERLSEKLKNDGYYVRAMHRDVKRQEKPVREP